MRHETIWHSRAVGEAPSTCNSVLEGWPNVVRGGPATRGIGEFGVSVVANVSSGRGQRGLRPKPTPGRPPRLSEAQKRTLVKRQVQGPLKAGYRTEVWTLGRIAALIYQEFGIRYHPSHVWKVLTSLGWSCQKPERRAVERDEAAIARGSSTTGRG
jgi:transposase